MISLIRAAVDRGITFFDTAEVYGPFTNEDPRRRGARAGPRQGRHRHQVRLRSQPRRKPRLSGPQQPPRAHPPGRRRLAQAPQHRLIDLFYQHRVDPEVPIEDVAGTVKDLIRQGKVKHFGLSEAGAKPSAAPTPSSPSPRYKTSTRSGGASPKKKSSHSLEELGIGFVPFSPLGKGFLTGEITSNDQLDKSDFRSQSPTLHA